MLPDDEHADTRFHALLHRAQEGEPGAFCELCRPIEERLFRQAWIFCRDESLAADLAQETLIAAWRNLGRYEGECQLFPWLYAILLAQIEAAIAYRLEGIDAARRVQDPMGDGPFEIRETEKDGRKGFVVTSAFEDLQYRAMFFPSRDKQKRVSKSR